MPRWALPLPFGSASSCFDARAASGLCHAVMSHKTWCKRRQGRSERIIKRIVAIGDEFLLPLRIGEEVALAGAMELRLLRGAAEIWGFRLSGAPAKVVVPPWAPAPRLLAMRSSNEVEMEKELPEVQKYLELRKWPVIVALRSQNVRDALASPAQRARLTAHRAWPSIIEHFQKHCIDFSSFDNPAVLLVMGPKGVGKSTCCRYLVNRLLSKVPEVYFLETDLGQPELGPPGVVTLHRLTEPLLRPPHAEQHGHDRVAAYFAGTVTPQTHPALYTASVAAAFEVYKERIKDCRPAPPLMVNSHGWVTGLGLEMLQQIVATVGAQLVVRLQVGTPERKVKAEDGKLKRAERSSLSRCGPLALALGKHKRGHEGEVIPNPRASLVLVDVESAVPEGSAAPLAVQLRWLRMAQHFKPRLDPCRPATAMAIQDFFEDVPRWRVPMGCLSFGLVAGHLLPNELEATLTGTVVALCSVEATEPHEFLEPHEAPIQFLAYAFVHSFDCKAREVVIYSSICLEKLKSANLLLRGEVTWEPNTTRNLQLGDGRLSPLQPYSAPWLLEGMGVGTRVISTKSRGHLRRRLIRKL